MTNGSGRPQVGFTLVEALVSTAIFGLMMVTVFSVLASNGSVFNRGLSKAETHQNARVALDQLARELRMAGHDVSGVIGSLANPTPIQSAEPDRVTFVADLDGDGALDQVTYRVIGERMLREASSWTGSDFSPSSSSVLASGVTALSIAYFDDAQPTNNAIATPVAADDLADVRRVAFSLTTAATTVREQRQFALFVDVKLRN